MIKAVFFDFDETLQDRAAAFDRFTNTFVQTFLPNLPQAEKEKRRRDMVETGNGGYVDRVEWFKGLIDLWHWANAPAAETLAAYYDENFGDHVVLFAGAKPLLQALRQRGILTGVITNGPSFLQNHKLDTSALRPVLDIAVVSGDVGVHKPDPAIFLYTAEKLGVAPADCLYVGDHPVNDIDGALSAGMQALRMNYGWFQNQGLHPDVPVVTEIMDVLHFIE